MILSEQSSTYVAFCLNPETISSAAKLLRINRKSKPFFNIIPISVGLLNDSLFSDDCAQRFALPKVREFDAGPARNQSQIEKIKYKLATKAQLKNVL